MWEQLNCLFTVLDTGCASKIAAELCSIDFHQSVTAQIVVWRQYLTNRSAECDYEGERLLMGCLAPNSLFLQINWKIATGTNLVSYWFLIKCRQIPCSTRIFQKKRHHTRYYICNFAPEVCMFSTCRIAKYGEPIKITKILPLT